MWENTFDDILEDIWRNKKQKISFKKIIQNFERNLTKLEKKIWKNFKKKMIEI